MAETMRDRFAAKLDGFVLEMETIDDTITNAIVRHEFPYRHGALLDNLGQKAREIKFRCYWFGESYAAHRDFLDYLSKREPCELQHPKYGIVKGQIESVSVRHDDRIETAEVDITFVEGKIEDAEPEPRPDVVMAAESQFIAGQEELMAEINDEITEALGPEGHAIIGQIVEGDRPLAWQLLNVSTQARAYLQKLDGYIEILEKAASGATVPGSILSLVTYPATVAGRLAGLLSRTAAQITSPLDTIRNQPARFLAALRVALRVLLPEKSSSVSSSPAKIAAAQRLALETAAVYQADEVVISETPAFDALGNYTGQAETQEHLTINEIENILAATRTDIQAAIDVSRSMTTLKKTAEALLSYVNKIKVERDKITAVEIPLWMPLHLVCLRYGLPHTYAERIHSINRHRHPNFIPAGEVQIYVK